MNLPFGIDISRWNYSADGKTKVDFDEIAAHEPKVEFIGIRSGVSWGYADPWFSRSWEEAKRIGRKRIAYHVLFPGESVKAQTDNLFRISDELADWEHDRIALDNELDHSQSPQRITDATNEFLEICESRTGFWPMIYSRANWVDQFMIVSEIPSFIQWWLANYRWPLPYPLYTPEKDPPPILPKGVTQWLVHQTASRGASIGAPANHFMDYNRWNIHNITLNEYFGYSDTEEPVYTDKEKLDIVWNHLLPELDL